MLDCLCESCPRNHTSFQTLHLRSEISLVDAGGFLENVPQDNLQRMWPLHAFPMLICQRGAPGRVGLEMKA